MKQLKEGLLNKKNIRNLVNNKYGVTKEDLIGSLEGFSIGIVIRILEETERQGNKPDVKIFQKDSYADIMDGGFSWTNSEDEYDFWEGVIAFEDFDKFYEKYPEYKRYDA